MTVNDYGRMSGMMSEWAMNSASAFEAKSMEIDKVKQEGDQKKECCKCNAM
jgi:hypothetical protein